MAVKPENPVVGGTVLRRAAIQSPNFVTGVSGWTINQDGSAEFNNLTLRGTFNGTNYVINSAGEFFYSGTPAAGNLVMSLARASGTDTFGNHYIGGLWTYAATTAIGIASGSQVIATASGSLAAGWSVATIMSNDGTNTFITAAGIVGLRAGGATADLATNAGGQISVENATLYTGFLPTVQIDISTNTAGNDANPHDVTKAWSIPAGDAVAGTTYTIKGLLRVNTGQTTIETLTLGVDLNAGTRTALATLGTAFNGGALNTVYSIPFELVLIADEIGTDNPGIYLQAVLADESANRLSTNSAVMNGHTDAATFIKANANTWAPYVQWGGAGGSAQNAHTTSSRQYREGP